MVLGVDIFWNFHFLPFSAVLGGFWLFLARCGHASARVALGKFIIHQMGWGLFLMVGGDSGRHFVIFGGWGLGCFKSGPSTRPGELPTCGPYVGIV